MESRRRINSIVGGKSAAKTHMTKPEISGIAPLFIVNDVPTALAFYRDRLGFDITFQGPEPNDIFFGIVQRGAAMIMFKASASIRCRTIRETSKKALPAGTPTSMSPIRTRWRQSSRRAISSFSNQSKIPMMACVDLNSRTLTATSCFSVVFIHELTLLFTGVRETIQKAV